ncbi:hypothetical protein BD410DRAFT_846580 [Rickenella mellea]|uniref:SAP domain-containing protein n=1 Tax=Rickenella mellea TaxID=50990 RepID=A0A4Y7PEP6_9AGAM|nr:hypothetical protein BD410DRAFT_846580 [Rickenella mellea]
MSVIISSATDSSGLVHEDETLVLPSISEYLNEGGTIPTYELVTTNLTKKVIQDYLRQYGLHITGNREVLLARLRTFAKDTENWERRFIPASPGSKKRKYERSAGRPYFSKAHMPHVPIKRRQRFCSVSEQARSLHYSRFAPFGCGVESSGIELGKSATRFLEDNEIAHTPAPIPSEEPNCESLVDDSEGNVSNTCEQLRSGGNTDSELHLQVRRLVRCVGQVESKVTAFMLRGFTLPSAPIAVANSHSASLNGLNDLNVQLDTRRQTPGSTSSDLTLSRGLVAQDNTPDEIAMPTTSPVPSSSGACGYSDSFLIDGKSFAFDFATVPDPPTANFAENVTELFRAWCDGNSIYFLLDDAEFFKLIQPDYGQFIMTERERYTTDDDFWMAFLTPNGSRMGITAIHKKLMDNRMSKSKASAADARRYFGEDLRSAEVGNKKIFTYKKSNKTFVISDDQKVAEIWETLLETNNEIAENWAAMTRMNNDPNEI